MLKMKLENGFIRGGKIMKHDYIQECRQRDYVKERKTMTGLLALAVLLSILSIVVCENYL